MHLSFHLIQVCPITVFLMLERCVTLGIKKNSTNHCILWISTATPLFYLCPGYLAVTVFLGLICIYVLKCNSEERLCVCLCVSESW